MDSRGGGTKFTPGHGPAVPQQCPETGARYLMGGPLWAEPIHNQEFVGKLIAKVRANLVSYRPRMVALNWPGPQRLG